MLQKFCKIDPRVDAQGQRDHRAVVRSRAAATVSRVTVQLDEELQKFARKALEKEYPYLVLDAR